jgi:ABC-2 type transport system permease protein
MVGALASVLSVGWQAIWRRRVGLFWWNVGLAGTVALLAVAYPTVRDNGELDKTFADLPPGVRTLLGLQGGNLLTSPAGYLNSQFFANILPVMYLVFAIGAAAWTVAGDEAAGTLEILLANPVGRARVALARLGALVLLLVTLAAVGALSLILLAPATGLGRGLPPGRMVAGTVGAALLALTFAALAYAVGAATGNRPAALAVASAAAVFGYLIEGLAQQVPALRPVRSGNPWHWLLDADPLRHGLTWHSWVLPLATTVVLTVLGTVGLVHRDLR